MLKMLKADSSSTKMMHHHSHSSSLSISNSSSSPKGRLNFFSKQGLKFGSSIRRESASSDRIYEPPPSDRIPTSPPFWAESDSKRSSGNSPSPDPFTSATHDTEFLHLRENIRRIRKAPSGPDPKKVDAVWEVYKRLREESLQLCKSLLQKSHNNRRNDSLELANIGPLDTRSSNSGSLELAPSIQVNEQWLSAINDYRATQEGMLENLRASLLATYKSYEPDATERRIQAFLADKALRKDLINKWRDTSVHRLKSEKHLFWELFKIRSLNFDKLKQDLQAVESLFDTADFGEDDKNMSIREYVIAANGDTILEFANLTSGVHPILRFRVFSRFLAEASPLFSQMFSLSPPGRNAPLDMLADLPPPPTTHTCKDGMEVKVYKMPQIESNENEALTLLLHAAHMHRQKVPREIEFSTFVSIAEVCLRYRCTSPIELQVEYQWLPQWVHMTGDEYRDGLLVISYAFGDRSLFTKITKDVILSAVDDAEIDCKKHWPLAVREKIMAVKAAKIAQIQTCCTSAIEEYFRPPVEDFDRQTSVGSLALTTIPRCPKRSHICDATNLGWLMLVFNELRVLPNVMQNVGFHNLRLYMSPKRSLKELTDCLRLMPSAPSTHGGVCDYAPAFRNAINDIYNSVVGLTLWDVSGRSGWALSKHAGDDDEQDELPPDQHELLAAVPSEEISRSSTISSNEVVCLQILLCLDDIDDLNAAAMINKGFYGVYRRNEALLLRNIMKAEKKRRTMSTVNQDASHFRDTLKTSVPPPMPPIPPSQLSQHPSRTFSEIYEGSRSLSSDDGHQTRQNDLYDVSPPNISIDQEDPPMSAEEAHRILWPDNLTPSQSDSQIQLSERNDKFLLGDVAHIEDKTRLEDGNKHLCDERDLALRLGTQKSG